MANKFTIEIEKETDGRWIADVQELPGVLAYGVTRKDAVSKAEALALRVVADRLETQKTQPQLTSIAFSFA